ncbi:hypothetical protein U1Q18_041048 [Sarracenia purpurea var. burkii]
MKSIMEGRFNEEEIMQKINPSKENGLIKLTKNNLCIKWNPKYQLNDSDLGSQIFQKECPEVDHRVSTAQEIVPSISLGLANPMNNSPMNNSPIKLVSCTDPISYTEPVRGDLIHKQSQASWGEETCRASKVQKWKRRARELKGWRCGKTKDGRQKLE